MPLKGVYKWYGGKVKKIILTEMMRRMDEVALYLENYVKDSLIVPFPPASVPGEPPHMRSGNLLNSIVKERIGLTLRVGVATAAAANYAKFLEIGTKKMAPRPFLRPALWNNEAYILKILGTRIYANVQLNLR